MPYGRLQLVVGEDGCAAGFMSRLSPVVDAGGPAALLPLGR
jgi:hypothetical protein